MTLTYKELEIELSLEGLLEVEEFHLTLGPNQHAYLSMKLLVKEENINDYVNLASVLPVKVCEKVATEGQILFQGKNFDCSFDINGSIKSSRMEIDMRKKGEGDREPTPWEIMKAYNGSGDEADRYADAAVQYYEAFKEYSSALEKLEVQR